MTKFEIWYAKPAHFGQEPETAERMRETHVHLKDLELEGGEAQLERVFESMQAESWSPTGEARELVRSKGLGHTSMSTGDCVVVDGRAHVVAYFGFRELPTHSELYGEK